LNAGLLQQTEKDRMVFPIATR